MIESKESKEREREREHSLALIEVLFMLYISVVLVRILQNFPALYNTTNTTKCWGSSFEEPLLPRKRREKGR